MKNFTRSRNATFTRLKKYHKYLVKVRGLTQRGEGPVKDVTAQTDEDGNYVHFATLKIFIIYIIYYKYIIFRNITCPFFQRSLPLVIGVKDANLYREDITRWREDINFMFEWQEQDLSLRSLVRYCSCHENIKFISSS